MNDDIILINDNEEKLKEKRRKAFTLVELLAVIVILAVVILIAVTAVIPRMNNAKKKSLLSEAEVYKKAAKEEYVVNHMHEEENAPRCITIDELNESYVKKHNDLSYSGSVVTDYVNGEVVQTISLSNGKYYVYGNGALTIGNVSDTKQSGFLSSCDGSAVATFVDKDETRALSRGDLIYLDDENDKFLLLDVDDTYVYLLGEHNLNENGRQDYLALGITYSDTFYWINSNQFGDSEHPYIYRTINGGDTDNNFLPRYTKYKRYLQNTLDYGNSVVDVRMPSLDDVEWLYRDRTSYRHSYLYDEFLIGSISDENQLYCSTYDSEGFFIVRTDEQYFDGAYVRSAGVRPIVVLKKTAIYVPSDEEYYDDNH